MEKIEEVYHISSNWEKPTAKKRILSPSYIADLEKELSNAFKGKKAGVPTKRKPNAYIGLKNLGATCYMNALLQALFFNCPLRQAIYSWPGTEADDASMYQLQLTFAAMQNLQMSSYNPKPFADSMGLFTNVQQDAQEFFKFLITHIEEMFKRGPSFDLPWGIDSKNFVAHQYEGKSTNIMKCSVCHNKSLRDNTFLELDVRINDAGVDTLQDCIKEYIGLELLRDDNKYMCSHCNEKQDAECSIELRTLPEVLNFQVLRFDYDKKTRSRKKKKTVLYFPMVLDMTPYMQGNAKPELKRRSSANANATSDGGDRLVLVLDEEDTEGESKSSRGGGANNKRKTAANAKVQDSPSKTRGGRGRGKSTTARGRGARDTVDVSIDDDLVDGGNGMEIDDRARLVNDGDENDCVYELTSYLIHKGANAEQGHYVANVKDENTNVWYHFDDDSVSRLPITSHLYAPNLIGMQSERQQQHQAATRASSRTCAGKGRGRGAIDLTGDWEESDEEVDLEDSEDETRGKKKQKRLEELDIEDDGYFKCGSCYFIVYSKRSTKAQRLNVPPEPPQHIQEKIVEENERFMSRVEDAEKKHAEISVLQNAHEKNVHQYFSKGAGNVPMGARVKCFWLPRAWLKAWIEGQFDLNLPSDPASSSNCNNSGALVPFSSDAAKKSVPVVDNDEETVSMEVEEPAAGASDKQSAPSDNEMKIEGARPTTQNSSPAADDGEVVVIGPPAPPVRLIDNTCITCPHGKLSAKDPTLARRISPSLWKFIVSRYGSPKTILTEQSYCEDCMADLDEKAQGLTKLMKQRDAWMAKYESFVEGCKEDNGGRGMAAVVGFIVARKWINGFKNFKNEKDYEKIEPTVNQSITCDMHEKLLTKVLTRVVHVPAELWNQLAALFPAAIAYKTNSELCDCTQVESAEVKKGRIEQRKDMKFLNDDKACALEPVGNRYHSFFLPYDFVLAWREFTSKDNKALREPPSFKIDMKNLVCEHGGLSFDPDEYWRPPNKSLAPENKLFRIVDSDTRVAMRQHGYRCAPKDVPCSTKMCELGCVDESRLMTLLHETQFQQETLTVVYLERKKPRQNARRKTANSAATNANPDGYEYVEQRVSVPGVCSDDSTYLLMLKIQQVIDIAPNRQSITQGDIRLESNSDKTLADYGVRKSYPLNVEILEFENDMGDSLYMGGSPVKENMRGVGFSHTRLASAHHPPANSNTTNSASSNSYNNTAANNSNSSGSNNNSSTAKTFDPSLYTSADYDLNDEFGVDNFDDGRFGALSRENSLNNLMDVEGVARDFDPAKRKRESVNLLVVESTTTTTTTTIREMESYAFLEDGLEIANEFDPQIQHNAMVKNKMPLHSLGKPSPQPVSDAQLSHLRKQLEDEQRRRDQEQVRHEKVNELLLMNIAQSEKAMRLQQAKDFVPVSPLTTAKAPGQKEARNSTCPPIVMRPMSNSSTSGNAPVRLQSNQAAPSVRSGEAGEKSHEQLQQHSPDISSSSSSFAPQASASSKPLSAPMTLNQLNKIQGTLMATRDSRLDPKPTAQQQPMTHVNTTGQGSLFHGTSTWLSSRGNSTTTATTSTAVSSGGSGGGVPAQQQSTPGLTAQQQRLLNYQHQQDPSQFYSSMPQEQSQLLQQLESEAAMKKKSHEANQSHPTEWTCSKCTHVNEWAFELCPCCDREWRDSDLNRIQQENDTANDDFANPFARNTRSASSVSGASSNNNNSAAPNRAKFTNGPPKSSDATPPRASQQLKPGIQMIPLKQTTTQQQPKQQGDNASDDGELEVVSSAKPTRQLSINDVLRDKIKPPEAEDSDFAEFAQKTSGAKAGRGRGGRGRGRGKDLAGDQQASGTGRGARGRGRATRGGKKAQAGKKKKATTAGAKKGRKKRGEESSEEESDYEVPTSLSDDGEDVSGESSEGYRENDAKAEKALERRESRLDLHDSSIEEIEDPNKRKRKR